MTSKQDAGKAITFFIVYVPGTIIFKLSFETSAESYAVFIGILIFGGVF